MVKEQDGVVGAQEVAPPAGSRGGGVRIFRPLIFVRSVNRLFFLLLLGSLLGSCSLLHPYRLPTPPLSPELKAQRKAAERARKQSARAAGKQSKEKADADEAPPAGAAPAGTAPATADAAPKEPPHGAKLKYDKNGLMKKPKLARRRVHKQPGKPFKPFAGLRHLFHHKSQPHGKAQPRPPRPDPVPAPAP